jgi:hypothetical protein
VELDDEGMVHGGEDAPLRNGLSLLLAGIEGLFEDDFECKVLRFLLL